MAGAGVAWALIVDEKLRTPTRGRLAARLGLGSAGADAGGAVWMGWIERRAGRTTVRWALLPRARADRVRERASIITKDWRTYTQPIDASGRRQREERGRGGG